MLRMLHIKDPCGADWGAMSGEEQRRFCAHCQKSVVALSELTQAEAERLVASAKPGSLCLRIEHDADGAVLLREEPRGAETSPIPSRPRSLFRVAVGASLLVAACRSEPPPAPGATPDLASRSQPSSAPSALDAPSALNAPSAAPLASAAPSSPPSALPNAEVLGAAPSRPIAAPDASSCDPKTGKATAKAKDHKVTMGCVCAPGDVLCSCL